MQASRMVFASDCFINLDNSKVIYIQFLSYFVSLLIRLFCSFRSILFVDNTHAYNLIHNFQINFVMVIRIVDFFIRKIMSSYRNYIVRLFLRVVLLCVFLFTCVIVRYHIVDLYLQVRSLILNIKNTID